MRRKSKKFNLMRFLRGFLLYSLLIIVAVYTLIPFATVLITSFRTEKDSMKGPFTWPKQWDITAAYSNAWNMGHFNIYIWNSTFIMIATVLGTLLVSTMAGYSFAKLQYPGRKGMYYLLLISMMVPFQTIMLPLYFVLKGIGMLNTLTGVSLLLIATGLGFAVMMMRSFFISFPDSLLESARLDGCTEIKVLCRIVLPNTFPAWSSLIVFVAMGAWNNLLAPMLYIFNESKYPVPYALYAFQDAHSTSYGLLSAAMVISILPIVLVYLIFQSKFQTNLLAGAVKG